MNMGPFPIEAVRFVEADMGWLGLGNYLEANEELEQIDARLRGHPEVLAVRWRIYAAAGKWETAVELASVVMRMAPGLRTETCYALAVEACRLNRRDEGRRWLGEAMGFGGNAMKLWGLADPALEWIWREGDDRGL